MNSDPLVWWDVVNTAGTIGLAIIFLWLFQTDKIRSSKQVLELHETHTKMVEVHAKVIEHKDKEIEWWRAAYTQQAERGDKQEEALRENMEMGRAMLTMLEGLSRVASRTPTARKRNE